MRYNTLHYNAIQYNRIHYNISVNFCLHDIKLRETITQKLFVTFIFISIYDLDFHLNFYDDFQFFLSSPINDVNTQTSYDIIYSNFFSILPALSLLVILAFSLQYMITMICFTLFL